MRLMRKSPRLEAVLSDANLGTDAKQKSSTWKVVRRRRAPLQLIFWHIWVSLRFDLPRKKWVSFWININFWIIYQKGKSRELSSSGDQLVSVVAVWCGLTPTLTTTEKEEEDCYLGSVRAPQNRYYRNLVPIFVFVLQLLEYLVDIGRLLYYYVLLPCTFFFQPGSPKEVLLTSMASQRHAQPLFSEGIS